MDATNDACIPQHDRDATTTTRNDLPCDDECGIRCSGFASVDDGSHHALSDNSLSATWSTGERFMGILDTRHVLRCVWGFRKPITITYRTYQGKCRDDERARNRCEGRLCNFRKSSSVSAWTPFLGTARARSHSVWGAGIPTWKVPNAKLSGHEMPFVQQSLEA
jgi:hypothetical protein